MERIAAYRNGRNRLAARVSVLCAAMMAFLLFAMSAGAAPVVDFDVPAPQARTLCIGSCPLVAATPRITAPLAWYGISTETITTAAKAMTDATATVAPVPLPAAGFMLVAGLGALGLLRRRGSDRPVPLRGALRDGARPAPERRVAPVRFNVPGGGISAVPRGCAPIGGGCLTAFVHGSATNARPTSGAGVRDAATAERAPPSFFGVSDRTPSAIPFRPSGPARVTASPKRGWFVCAETAGPGDRGRVSAFRVPGSEGCFRRAPINENGLKPAPAYPPAIPAARVFSLAPAMPPGRNGSAALLAR